MPAHQNSLGPRGRLPDRDRLLDRKRRQTKRYAANGAVHGLVEIPGPLSRQTELEIRALASSLEKKEKQRDAGARVLAITEFKGGLAIETASEKLAQHIADAVGRSRCARVERVFDDEGRRRILTCHIL